MIKNLLVATLLLLSTTAYARPLSFTTAGGKTTTTLKVIELIGSVSKESLMKFQLDYLSVKELPGDFVIYISSPGGLVTAGDDMIKIIDVEKALGNKIVCVVDRGAHSMAFNLLTHCDIRYATMKSTSLVHKLAGYKVECGEHPLPRCTAEYLRGRAAELDELDEPYRQLNALEMHLSLEDYDLLTNNETIFTAAKLLEMHYLVS